MSNRTLVVVQYDAPLLYEAHKQAARAVENCACAWEEFGVSLRGSDAGWKRSCAARNHQAAMRDPLPFSELPGLMYEPALGREAGARVQRGICDGSETGLRKSIMPLIGI